MSGDQGLRRTGLRPCRALRCSSWAPQCWAAPRAPPSLLLPGGVCRLQVDMTGPLAERVAESVPKGTQVLVEGRLKVNKWTDKTTGTSRTNVVVG